MGLVCLSGRASSGPADLKEAIWIGQCFSVRLGGVNPGRAYDPKGHASSFRLSSGSITLPTRMITFDSF